MSSFTGEFLLSSFADVEHLQKIFGAAEQRAMRDGQHRAGQEPPDKTAKPHAPHEEKREHFVSHTALCRGRMKEKGIGHV